MRRVPLLRFETRDGQNLQWREVENGALVLAQAGELTWPMETAIVSLGAAHLGWYFSETAAAAVASAWRGSPSSSAGSPRCARSAPR